MNYTLEELDEMEGHDFEYAVADLLRYNGYRDVEVTQGSGDYGIDILARRKSVKYAIQCKRYNSSVGVRAVRDAASGADYYHCDMAAVITNNVFTRQAINMAETIGVRLCDRSFLSDLIENYDEGYDEIYAPELYDKKIKTIKTDEQMKNESLQNYVTQTHLQTKITKQNQAISKKDKVPMGERIYFTPNHKWYYAKNECKGRIYHNNGDKYSRTGLLWLYWISMPILVILLLINLLLLLTIPLILEEEICCIISMIIIIVCMLYFIYIKKMLKMYDGSISTHNKD